MTAGDLRISRADRASSCAGPRHRRVGRTLVSRPLEADFAVVNEGVESDVTRDVRGFSQINFSPEFVN
jgi:hypothetical protein